mgnify:CR=1 FL=1
MPNALVTLTDDAAHPLQLAVNDFVASECSEVLNRHAGGTQPAAVIVRAALSLGCCARCARRLRLVATGRLQTICLALAVGLVLSDSSIVVLALPDILDNLAHGGRVAVLGLPSKEISINWAKLVTHMITIKGIYGREMYETWYAMNSLIQTGLDIRDVITDRFPANDWQKAFAAAKSSNSGKVVMDWS